MRLTIVSATPFEIAPLSEHLEAHFQKQEDGTYQKGELNVQLLITGVGSTATAFALGQYLAQNSPDLLINAGIAGAFDRQLELGQVLHVISERFGDLGVEEADGRFTDVHELGLIATASPPFTQGQLLNPESEQYNFLPKVTGLTVNKVHGYPPSIATIQQKYPAAIESMEGAAFFYACLLAQKPFLEIRSISNYVEARDKSKWQIALAIDRLNEVLLEMLAIFTPPSSVSKPSPA